MSPSAIFSHRNPPATLTSTSMPPKRMATAAITLRVPSTSARSAPPSSMCPAPPYCSCNSAEGCDTSTSASRAPVAAKACATAEPSAPNAPVMTTTRVAGSDMRSALRYVDGEPALARFLVDRRHVVAGLAHRRDHLVERHHVRAVAAHRELRGIDRLHRTHRVAFDAGNLHEAGDGVACQPQVVLHADLGRVLDLLIGAVHRGDEPGCGHRAGDADFALATHLGTRD